MERNWGFMDQLTHEERVKKFGETLKDRKELAWFWRPSDGETLQDVFNRRYTMFMTYRRECSNLHCVQVSHGEIMIVDRYLLEYWVPDTLRKYMLSHSPQVHIENCRIIQYTRYDAHGELQSKLQRVRFVNPWAPDNPETNLDWHSIVRPLFTHSELLAEAEKFQQYLDM